jgi:PA domain
MQKSYKFYWHKLFGFCCSQCLPNSLSPDKVKGKIVVCFRGSGLRAEKGQEVKRAGGAAIILGNLAANGDEVPVDAHVLPAVGVSTTDATEILTYINSSSNPTASLGQARTVVDVRPSPSMAQFSSRGPNVIEPNILKVIFLYYFIIHAFIIFLPAAFKLDKTKRYKKFLL